MRTLIVAMLLPTVLLAACPLGYQYYVPGKCVKFGTTDLYYAEAREQCQNDGAELISIHSQTENDGIYALSPTGDSFWIGLECDPDKRTFTWTDGTPLDYFGFSDVSCPSDRKQFIMDRDNGQWLSGSDTFYYFICAIDQGVDDSRCSSGYQFEEETSMCLKVVKEPNTWQNAESACQADSGHLVSIHDQPTNAFVRRIAYEKALLDGIFVGLQLINGTPTWSDGTAVDYSNFDIGMPNGIFGACGALLTRYLEGEWVSVHCDQLTRLPYVCARNASVQGSPCPINNTFTNGAEVYSPGYPSSNAPRLTCEYFFAAPEGNHVLLEFPELSLSDGDSIQLFEGETSQNPIATLSNTSNADIYRTKADNVLRMVYTTGEGNGPRNWHLQFMTIF